MNTCNKQLYILLVLSQVLTLSVLKAGDEIFSTTAHNQKRNMYANITNRFDVAYSHFSVGEFQIVSSNKRSDILFEKPEHVKEEQTGSNLQGYDSILSKKYVTEAFTPLVGDSLKFYLESWVTTTGRCHEYLSEEEDPQPAALGKYVKDWRSCKGGVLDETKVIIRVESISQPSIYVDVDSIIIPTNPTSRWVNYRGMSMDDYNHLIVLPKEMSGIKSRIRLLIFRNGSTPLGATGNWEKVQTAKSDYRCPWAVSRLTKEENESLESRYKVCAEAYMRSVLSLSNKLYLVNHLLLDDSTWTRIVSDYFVIEIDSNNPSSKRLYPLDFTKDLTCEGEVYAATKKEVEIYMKE